MKNSLEKIWNKNTYNNKKFKKKKFLINTVEYTAFCVCYVSWQEWIKKFFFFALKFLHSICANSKGNNDNIKK